MKSAGYVEAGTGQLQREEQVKAMERQKGWTGYVDTFNFETVWAENRLMGTCLKHLMARACTM